MLADFYIPRLLNDMKIAVEKNNFGGCIWYRRLDHVKKTASLTIQRNILTADYENKTLSKRVDESPEEKWKKYLKLF